MEGATIKINVFIDTEVIRQNVTRIKQNLARLRPNGTPKFMLMLKADAYGHGLATVAKRTQDIVDAFGVFSLEEGLEIRKTGVKTPVLVNMIGKGEIETAVKNGLAIGLSNREQLDEINSLVERKTVRAQDVNLHIKVDSGMHRLGFDVQELDNVLNKLKELGVNVKGVYSHFGDHWDMQTDRFVVACDKVMAEFPATVRHIASSHTAYNPELLFDGVRIGLSAYLGAMSVESSVVATRYVQSGEYIGYGNFKADRPMNVAVVFGGYADGVDRENFASVWHGENKFKVIGVCMDSLIVDTGDDKLEIGDKITILRADKIFETAEEQNTIPYTLMTAWRGRTNKIYI